MVVIYSFEWWLYQCGGAVSLCIYMLVCTSVLFVHNQENSIVGFFRLYLAEVVLMIQCVGMLVTTISAFL